MCTVCGCLDLQSVNYTVLGAHTHDHPQNHGHDHSHGHSHSHGHEHTHAPPAEPPAALHAVMHDRTIALEQDILAKNQILAERNQGWFDGRGVLALNLMSSPGSGKTSLLERTTRALQEEARIYVVEGDPATSPTTPSASAPPAVL